MFWEFLFGVEHWKSGLGIHVSCVWGVKVENLFCFEKEPKRVYISISEWREEQTDRKEEVERAG